MDSTFQPEPPGGWFGGNLSLTEFLALNYFQTAPWFHLAFDPAMSSEEVFYLGSRSKAAGLENPLISVGLTALGNGSSNITGLSSAIASVIENTVSTAGNGNSSWKGILGNFETKLFFNTSVNANTFNLFANTSNNASDILRNLTQTPVNQLGLPVDVTLLQPIPWFDTAVSSLDNDLDDQISKDLLTTIHLLTSINATQGFRLTYRSGSIYAYPAVSKGIQIVSNLPWGNVRFISAKNGTYVYTIQAGRDSRIASNVLSYPVEGLRRMVFQIMLAKAARIFPLKMWIKHSD